MPKAPDNLSLFSTLVEIVKILRGPEGCPWDKEQTHQSLSRYAIEEAYELAEAIDLEKDENLKEELGDLLLQVVLHSELARQEGRFHIHDVISGISEKMIRRHPHVFGTVQVTGPEDVLSRWQEIKLKEKKKQGTDDQTNLFQFNLPPGLPSLLTAHQLGEKSGRWKFDWEQVNDVFEKISEEYQELKEALLRKQKSDVEQEIGDLLFTVAQLARHCNLEGETALRKANTKFQKRFSQMLVFTKEDQKEFTPLTPSEKEHYWQKAKDFLNKQNPES